MSQQRVLDAAIKDYDRKDEYKRAKILFMIVMMAAGNFVGNSIRWDKGKNLRSSHDYLAETNLDVITAETIVWLTFLMGEFWKSDQKNDRDMYLRIGFSTLWMVGELGTSLIESKGGFEFKETAGERRKFYRNSKEKFIIESFNSVMIGSIGKKEPKEKFSGTGISKSFEAMMMNVRINTFFVTMPPAFYETFKNILKEWPHMFPKDQEFED